MIEIEAEYIHEIIEGLRKDYIPYPSEFWKRVDIHVQIYDILRIPPQKRDDIEKEYVKYVREKREFEVQIVENLDDVLAKGVGIELTPVTISF
jgi:hypothetical protein